MSELHRLLSISEERLRELIVLAEENFRLKLALVPYEETQKRLLEFKNEARVLVAQINELSSKVSANEVVSYKYQKNLDICLEKKTKLESYCKDQFAGLDPQNFWDEGE